MMAADEQFESAAEAVAETAARLGWRSFGGEEICAACLNVAFGYLTTRHGNYGTAEILDDLAELLRRRPPLCSRTWR